MRVGVDATCWQNARGYGRHARALLSSLVRLDTKNQYTFFIDSAEVPPDLPAKAKVVAVKTSLPTAVAASANGHRSLRDLWRMSCSMSASTFDLLLFPTVYSYVPVFSRAKKIVMIHDVIAETYPELTLPSRVARLLWRGKTVCGRWQADAIVTVSDYSRGRIQELLNISPRRIFVVGEASDPIFRVLAEPVPISLLESLGVTCSGRLVVYVGGFSPHKNLEALVSTFARLAAQEIFSDVRLVMVGEYKREVFHTYFGVIKKLVEKLRITDRVFFTGFLADEELVVLLNAATVLVLPSMMEGFGLPAVEAAACGCPVIATQASPLPSLLDGAAVYIDPAKPDDLEMALRRVLESESLRLKMREAGLAAARRLTWDSAARQMISIMRAVTGQ